MLLGSGRIFFPYTGCLRYLSLIHIYYGTPYFVNYMGNGMKPEDVRTSYEGIRPDFRVLRKKSGGFFGYGEHTGSVGVVTINLPRIAYQSKGEKEFFARLDQMMDLACLLYTSRCV